MTSIILVMDPVTQTTKILNDPRSRRELVKAINTGVLVVGKEVLKNPRTRQWAVSHAPLDVVTVHLRRPPVHLTERHYDILYGLADGKTIEQIAHDLRLSIRTVYMHVAVLKHRLGAVSLTHLLLLAAEKGLIGDEPGCDG